MEPNSQRTKIRPPAVAGLFYAGDPHRLQTTVAELLAEAPSIQERPTQSADRAACRLRLFGRLSRPRRSRRCARGAQAIKRVVLIGPAHFVPAARHRRADGRCLRNAARPRSASIARRYPPSPTPFVVEADAPHAPEHALEVELPFLQALLASFALVPLVIGDADRGRLAEVLRRLLGRAGNG